MELVHSILLECAVKTMSRCVDREREGMAEKGCCPGTLGHGQMYIVSIYRETQSKTVLALWSIRQVAVLSEMTVQAEL